MHSPTATTSPPFTTPSWWQTCVGQVNAFLDRTVKRGTRSTLATSPSGHPIHLITYGDPEPHLRGPTNFNSAAGANAPDAYVRRQERKRPVLLILAANHGHEDEGLISTLSLIQILETGHDLRGAPQPQLQALLSKLRLLILPLTNPDGRARVPYDSLAGQTVHEMHRVGQGTRPDGKNHGYPHVKKVHPMTRDSTSFLGAYFDDNGVNLMHDNFTNPFSKTTAALTALTTLEAPDLLLNLHSCEYPPHCNQTDYTPIQTKQALTAFATELANRLAQQNIPTLHIPKTAQEGTDPSRPPALNLTSILYHCGAHLPITFESPTPLSDAAPTFSPDQILSIHHTLFQLAAETLLPPTL